MRIKQEMLNIILVCFTFYEPTIMPHSVFLFIKYFTIIWMLLKYFDGIRRNKAVMVTVYVYGIVTVLSSVYNGMAINTIVASIFFALQIIVVFLISEQVIRKYGVMQYIEWLFKYFLVICLVTDVCMLFMGYDFSDASEAYLIGNKFSVSYVHCFVASLAFARAGDMRIRASSSRGKIGISKNGISKRGTAYVITLLSVMISSIVTCSTGMIISVLLIALMLLPEWLIRIISSGKFMVIGTAIINILMFGSYSLLTNPVVINFVQNILGKSADFTGRTQIWEIIFIKIAEKPILGYGYYNNVINNILGYGNPQNGVLKLLLDTGILGLIAYAILVFKSFSGGDDNYDIAHRAVASFYIVMLVASLAEINLLHMIVFLAMAIALYSSQFGKDRGDIDV